VVIESADPDVTIAVVPREQWGVVRTSLESIFEHTPESFELIYVDGGSPPDASRWLREESERRGFRLLRSDGYLTPNQARNWALRHAHGRYIVFVDNDLIVSPGWLSAMLTCAEETGAWAVGPLYLEGDPTDDVIHMAVTPATSSSFTACWCRERCSTDSAISTRRSSTRASISISASRFAKPGARCSSSPPPSSPTRRRRPSSARTSPIS
jgi:glycosyltransferase involved in cell wall biosynthesis